MKKIVSLASSAFLAAAVMLAGCSSSQPAAEPQGSGQQTPQPQANAQQAGSKMLYLNNLQEPTSLDPPIGFDQISYDILNNMMEGLTRLGKDQKPEPAMAEKWEVSQDGKTYTFHLRDSKWSNGDPVTAQDFEYAWKRLSDPKTGSSAAFLANVIAGAEEFNAGKGKAEDVQVKAVDNKTLEVHLKQPASWFLLLVSNPAFFPVHKATVEKNPDWAKEAATILSNGPFKLTEWVHDSQLVMVKNENYWDAANVKLDGVTWKMVNDRNTAYQLFQTGELHTTEVPPDLAEQLFAENKVTVTDSAGTEFYRFNVTKPPFTNKNIRKAFSLAIDRQLIVDVVNKQKQKIATGYVSYSFLEPDGKDFRDVGGELIKYDPVEAKKLLEQGMKEAGYTTLPPVTLSVSSGGTKEKVAQVIQEMIKKNLGVEIKIEVMESKALTAKMKSLDYQWARSSFLPDFGDPINFLDGFLSDNPFNRTGWKNPQFDNLIKQAYNEADDTKRFQLMHQAEQVLMDDAPIAPLFFYNSAYLQSDKAVDIVRHALGYMDLKWADLKP
ncbi:peptide ABC transporter substrate-binding protein [Brevibacillus sp. SYP-B805]|uniref:peptide ABC transporter substrate-binding protein n=1 Tax=Brevibacillus sp. SYP-B805 TaxID=1578199 RepID=UPI0013EC3C6E|nr:peptide ABC transporter substrate-binding protein [Brevibacillus sp. SYP-B805]NGQ94393.1 peptide ABC transporter substrate-binding protein [Brevibacillus sp. SYP-B805]